MNINVGIVDKVVRIIVGLTLIALTLMGAIGVWGWLGAILLVTGLMGRCPLYAMLGVNTCPTHK